MSSNYELLFKRTLKEKKDLQKSNIKERNLHTSPPRPNDKTLSDKDISLFYL